MRIGSWYSIQGKFDDACLVIDVAIKQIIGYVLCQQKILTQFYFIQTVCNKSQDQNHLISYVFINSTTEQEVLLKLSVIIRQDSGGKLVDQTFMNGTQFWVKILSSFESWNCYLLEDFSFPNC
jgi:hypothetical protein